MTKIPIISGIYAKGEFRTSYPVNLVPVPKQTGISEGYLRPADGLVEFATGPGVDRGGVVWRGFMYRVMGEELVYVGPDGQVVSIGFVGGSGPVTFAVSFDYLAVCSNNRLFLYNDATLQLVTDTDLGAVHSLVWVDGYFMTTDGEFLVVTELNDPFAVNPLKYGSSEAEPDPVVALLKLRNEVYALNATTIEVFSNAGTTGFPFQRIEGAQIQKGTYGAKSCCVLAEAIAFLGGGRNEAPAIYIGANGSAAKVSTREIDQILAAYSETDLAAAWLESKVEAGHIHLIVHLPRHTLVYDAAASQAVEAAVWFYLSTEGAAYQGRGMVWAYGGWYCGAGDKVARLSSETGDQLGAETEWEFATPVLYNEGRGAILSELEIVALPGRPSFGDNPQIGTCYSLDGEEWSQVRYIPSGTFGERAKRLVWRQQGKFRNFRMQKFLGTSRSPIVPTRLEARLEPLQW